LLLYWAHFLGVILWLWLRLLSAVATQPIEFANVAGMQEGQWFDIAALMWHYFSYPTRSKWREADMEITPADVITPRCH